MLCGTGCHISVSRFQAHNDTSALREHLGTVCSMSTMHSVLANLENQVMFLQSCTYITLSFVFMGERELKGDCGLSFIDVLRGPCWVDSSHKNI